MDREELENKIDAQGKELAELKATIRIAKICGGFIAGAFVVMFGASALTIPRMIQNAAVEEVEQQMPEEVVSAFVKKIEETRGEAQGFRDEALVAKNRIDDYERRASEIINSMPNNPYVRGEVIWGVTDGENTVVSGSQDWEIQRIKGGHYRVTLRFDDPEEFFCGTPVVSANKHKGIIYVENIQRDSFDVHIFAPGGNTERDGGFTFVVIPDTR